MASKLIIVAPYEAPNQLEVSLREAYAVLLPKLTPPLSLTIPSAQEYLNLNMAILYGVLCEPTLAKAHLKYLHAIVSDGYSFFIKLLARVVDELYIKMLELPKVQLIWVASLMVDVTGIGFDSLLVSLLRQIVGGDFSDGNLWLSYETVNLFLSKWDLILDEEPVVLTFALYTYLRLLADHYRLPHSPRSMELKRKEIGFCIRMLREHFPLCLRIGRDLIRLLQDLVHVPDFGALWKDLVLNPASFGAPGFSDVSDIYSIRTSSRYISLRITPEMETQLRFLLTQVKLGTQRRHLVWFARKFLFTPERETLICDIVRFICCAYHPSKELLQSDIIPRWAVIGWLLASCTKKYIEANVKLALFYDWLFFDDKVDDVMSIEPAMLLMVNSIPRYMDITQSLVEFLLLLVDNYDLDRKNVILNGVSSAMNTLVRKEVISSFDVLTSCNLFSPFLKRMLLNFVSMVKSITIEAPLPYDYPSHDVPSQTSPSPFIVELQAHPSAGLMASPGNVALVIKPNAVENVVSSAASLGSCGLTIKRHDDLGILIAEIGENMKKSNKVGQEIVEKILILYLNRSSHEKSGALNPEFVALEVKKKLELAGYKLFTPLDNLPVSVDADDEVQSVTAVVIQTFIFSQHQCFVEMLLSWSRNGLLVRERLLSYAVRLAYEAHLAGYGDNFTGEIDYANMMPLLRSHLKGYFTFLSGGVVDTSGAIAPASKVDKKLISKVINGAFSSYRIMFDHSVDALSKEPDISHGKILLADIMSCSLWKNKNPRALLQVVFSYLSDLVCGNENVILLLVSKLDHVDIVSMQIDLALKRFAILGEDVQNVLHMVRKSICWEPVEQHKLWGLVRSEFSVSEFPVQNLLLDFFFSDDLDPKASGIAVAGLMILCSSRGPTPELVGAVMLLPNNKFPDFVAAILSNWMITNAAMLFNNIADFFDKLEKKDENIPVDWGGIVINQSAILFLLKYLEAQGEQGVDMLEKLALSLSGMKARMENLALAMDTG